MISMHLRRAVEYTPTQARDCVHTRKQLGRVTPPRTRRLGIGQNSSHSDTTMSNASYSEGGECLNAGHVTDNIRSHGLRRPWVFL